MSLENAKVLYKHFVEIGRKDWAKQQVKNYPELLDNHKDGELVSKPKPKEVKKDDKKQKR